MSDIVQGMDCLFQLDTGGGYLPFVCAKSFSLSLDSEFVDTTGLTDGQWKAYDYDSLGYQINLGGVMKIIDAAGITVFDIMALQMGFTEVKWRSIYNDTNGNTKVCTGIALISNTTLNVQAGSLIDTPITLQGTGSYTTANTTEVCTGSISNILMGLGADPVYGRVFNITYSGINRIDYTIDGGASATVFPDVSPYALELIFAAGVHNMVFTPICANGVSGVPYPYGPFTV